jgi:CheY-like chemotaxis protein
LAEDGERGLGLFIANQEEIDLILTDVSMPRMSGPEMARQIRRIDSEVKLIFMTGYSPSQIVPVEFEGCPTLRKPFTPIQLFHSLDECLKDRQRNG